MFNRPFSSPSSVQAPPPGARGPSSVSVSPSAPALAALGPASSTMPSRAAAVPARMVTVSASDPRTAILEAELKELRESVLELGRRSWAAPPPVDNSSTLSVPQAQATLGSFRAPSPSAASATAPAAPAADILEVLTTALKGRRGRAPARRKKSRAPRSGSVRFASASSGASDEDSLSADEETGLTSGADLSDPDDAFLPTVLDRLRRKYRNSAATWVAQTKFKNFRNEREALAWAEAVDSYRKDHPRARSSHTLDLLCRRMAGVHLADATGNWSVCEVLQGDAIHSSLVDNDLLRDVAKKAKLQASLGARPAGGAASAGTATSAESSASSRSKSRSGGAGTSGGFDYSAGGGRASASSKKKGGAGTSHLSSSSSKKGPSPSAGAAGASASSGAGADA